MIPLTTYGRPAGFARPIVGVREPELEPDRRRHAVIVTDSNLTDWPEASQYRAIVTTLPLNSLSAHACTAPIPTVQGAKSVAHLRPDIVTLMPRSGLVRTVFRAGSNHNFLFATARCNSFCLMCSQPPVDRDDSEQVQINIEAIRLMEPAPERLGITGGEPTLLREGLFQLLYELREVLPETNVHMLTNGR